MNLINIADFFLAIIQSYVVSVLACRNFKTKYSYKTSMLICVVGLVIQYNVVNYLVFIYELRAVIGILHFLIMSFLLFEGTKKWKMFLGILGYLFMIGIDMINVLFVNPWMQISLKKDMFISSRLLLVRNIFNISIFLVIVLIELLKNRKRGKQYVIVALLSLTLSVCQLLILKNLYQANRVGTTASAVMISIIYSAIVILGYFIVTELFEQIIEQQKKQTELEHMTLEKKYQYDYYKKAVAQSERLRDLRHDIRNQLQTVEYLIQSESSEEQEKALKMMERLSERTEI